MVPDAAMPAVIHEMSAKRLGITTVQSQGVLLGNIGHAGRQVGTVLGRSAAVMAWQVVMVVRRGL